MASIGSSVGLGGVNRKADVETVQRLLIQKGAKIVADGACGPATIAAIKAFQATFLRAPDGRVDPNGNTMQKLNAGGGGAPGGTPAPGSSPTPAPTGPPSAGGLPPRLDVHTFDTFVSKGHDVKYKDFPDTKKLILTIMPYYPKEVKVIGGYLDDSDQFWKVNYHWELLLSKINKALSVTLSASNRTSTEALYKTMLGNPPNPQTGYMASKVMGYPKDSSSNDVITQRHGMVKTCKQQFKTIMNAESLPTKYPDGPMWDLAVAPVAPPGQSTHGKGYALDIFGTGLNAKIKEISNGLGATLSFDEKSHVHVEFAKGTKLDT